MSELLDEPESKKTPIVHYLYVDLIWLGLFALGHLMKLKHFPFANLVILIAMSGLIAYNAATKQFAKTANKWNRLFLIFCGIWMLFVMYAYLNNFGAPYTINGIVFCAGITTFIYAIHFIVFTTLKGSRAK